MYKHVKTDHIYPGLPAGDLTDVQVPPELSEVMASLVRQGVYEMYMDVEPPEDAFSPFDETKLPEESEEADEH